MTIPAAKRRRHQAILVAILCALAATAALFGKNPSSTPSPDAAQAMVNRYCTNCHNEDLKTGGVSLTGVRASAVGAAAGTWEKVFRKVRTGEMPPFGMPRPDAPVIASFTTWLETELDRAALARPNPGTPSIHRLNRVEYGNAVRDLLALDLDHSSSLPADDSGYGFDNIGEVLTVSPLHLEKYMSTARRVARLAVGTVNLSPAIEKFSAGRASAGEMSDELPLSVRGGIVFRRHFPVDAEYSILVRLRGNPDPNMPPPKLDVRVDGNRVKLFDANISLAEEAQYTRSFEFRLPLKAGMHVVGAGLLTETTKPVIGGARRGVDPPPPTPASVDYVLVGGPFNATGPGETESRKRIFSCRPAAGDPEEPCARKILTSLTRQAYRRPTDKADIEPLMKLFATGRKDGGSFDSGIETALRAILVSPSFLFRVERSPRGSAPGTVHRVTDLELASRLAFFLWSSIPDEELLRLAEHGKLRSVLNQQVSRMLADPKSRSLVDNFAGQWLHLRNVATWRPDPDKYREFDEPLRDALQRETELFFEHIVREDRSVLEFLNADYSILNERLARHYGIPGVRGSYYRRVALNGNERGGILTHGSILTVTSYPTRTSPVLRGKWILDNVLGAPPPPPPPDVPALAESASSSTRDLRTALEKHRANAACASCHARLDPLGFALENYDAVGKFRTSEGGADIDASGSLPGGTTVHGAGDLKKVLMERRDEFVQCLAEKLLTYALGRGLEHYDLPAVRQIRREVARNDYRFSSLAFAIVNSVPFQMRRIAEP
jgi:mono/diheme cytochrome c family protein